MLSSIKSRRSLSYLDLMATALEGAKVIDLSQEIAGPFCTKLLADYGADVIKVEPPHVGDKARHMGPFKDDHPHPEKSGLFLYLNTNKRSLTLNLETATGRQILRRLVEGADILVESYPPGYLDGLGLGYKELSAINPRLVMTSITWFGQTGPYKDFQGSEIVLYAMGGEMYSTGIPEREPIKTALTTSQVQAGAMAAVATMGAYLLASAQGQGQHIDLSMMEALCGGIDRRASALIGYQYTGEITPRAGGMGVRGYPAGVYPCQDGYIEIVGGAAHWQRIVKMLGEPEFLKDPKWTQPTAQTDPQLYEEFMAFFIPWLMERSKREIWRIAQENHVICAPLNTPADVYDDPHFNQRGFFVDVEHPVVGRFRMPGRPFIMSETPWQLRRPAPLLGEHTEEILQELGYTQDDILILRQTGVI
jgi:crotonobetainyl-CoA:carnitine CoA-transferase CaiB-like acyl-CoA transferase